MAFFEKIEISKSQNLRIPTFSIWGNLVIFHPEIFFQIPRAKYSPETMSYRELRTSLPSKGSLWQGV